MGSRMLCLNVKIIGKISLFAWRLISAAVDGFDSWSRWQIIDTT